MNPMSTARWQRLRLVILRRDGFRCYWCGGTATQADHLTARAQGGNTFDPSNLVAACGPCNGRRGAETARQLANPSFRSGERFRPRMLKSESHKVHREQHGAIRL